MLQHIIRGSALQRFNGQFLPHNSGQEDERNIAKALSDNTQGRQTVENGQQIVGQDQINAAILQSLDEIRFRIDQFNAAIRPVLFEFFPDQLSIDGTILQMQKVQCISHVNLPQ